MSDRTTVDDRARPSGPPQALENGTYTGSGTLAPGITYAPAADGHGILVGDKLITNFGAMAVGDMPAAGNINVVGVIDAFGNLGIRFQGFFNDQVGGGHSDLLITYHVHVTDPNKQIFDAHIVGNPAVAGGTGSIVVAETFTGLPNTMTIFAINPGMTQRADSTIFAMGVTDLDVQKDIGAFAGTGLPSASFIDQTCSQRAVPEPGSIALLMIGGAGAFGLMRRRKANVEA